MATSTAILPRFVALRGDNSRLLITSPTGRTPILEFSALEATAISSMASVHEVTVVDQASGRVAIRYLGNGRYWQVSFDNPYRQDIVMANFDGLPTSSNTTALFLPVRLTSDTLALQSISQRLYCDRRANNFLLPRASTIESNGRMVVREPVTARSLLNIRYDLDRANIYNSRLVALNSATGQNNSSLPGQVSLTLTYTTSSTRSWSNAVTVSVGIEMSFNAGVPLIAEGGITVSASVSNTTTWGAEQTNSTEVSSTYTVTDVPPGHSVRVTVSGTEAQCDVPFSYMQVDTLPDGSQHRHDHVDGVYRGANVFNIVWEARDVTTNRLLPLSLSSTPSN